MTVRSVGNVRNISDLRSVKLLEWEDVKDEYIRSAVNRELTPLTLSSQPHKSQVVNRSPYDDNWTGATKAQMAKWLREGYTSEEFDAIDDYTPRKKTRRVVSDFEGIELDFAEAWSGIAEPWHRWEARERKPGLKISAELCFASGVPASTIEKYGAWLMGLMQGLETKGYDLDVVITCTGDFMYMNPSQSIRSQCQIRVTREGEQNDLHDWSALFSPGGFRHLGFTALSMMAEREGRTMRRGYANSLPGNDWVVGFDGNIRELRIDVPQRGSAGGSYSEPFDAQKMDAAIREVSDLLE